MRMVHIGHMRVLVSERLVTMPMRVRLAGWIIRRMRVLVVLIVHVRMRMFHWLVLMFVVVILGEVQPDAYPHQ